MEEGYKTIGKYLYGLHQNTGGATTWDDIVADDNIKKLLSDYGINDMKSLAANQRIKSVYLDYKSLQQVEFDASGTDQPDVDLTIKDFTEKVMPKKRTEGQGYYPGGLGEKEAYKGGGWGEDKPVPPPPKQLKGQLRVTGSAMGSYQPDISPYITPDNKTPEEINQQQRKLQKETQSYEFRRSNGMMMRMIDVPLQYLKAGIVLSHGKKLPPDYTWFDPVKRVEYPNERYFIDMRAITGMDWEDPRGFALNLSGEFILDPINMIGGWETKASKGVKVARGLATIPEETEKLIKIQGDVFKAARKAKTLEVIAPHLEKIPKPNRGKSVNNVLKGVGVEEIPEAVKATPKAVEPLAVAGKVAKPPSKKIGIEMLYHGESRRAQYARSQGMKPISDIVKETGLPKTFLKDAGFLLEKGEWHHVMRGNKLVEEFFQDMPDAEKLLDLRRGYKLYREMSAFERKLPKSGRVTGSEDLWTKYDATRRKYIKWREGDLSEEELSKIVIKAPPQPIDTAVKPVVKPKPQTTADFIEASKTLDAGDVEKSAESLRRYYKKNHPEMSEVLEASLSVARGESGKGKALFSLYEMLDDMKSIGTGPDTVLKYLGNADNYDDLMYRFKLLGVDNPSKSKDLKYLLDIAQKNPRRINELFQEYTLLSDQIRQGHVGYGFGIMSGWGREGQFNLLKPKAVREMLGNVIETIESLYVKGKHYDLNRRLIPEVVKVEDGAAVIRGLRNFEKTVERMQYGWEAEIMKRTSMSKALRKEVLIDQLATMGIDGKDVLRQIEGLPTSNQNTAIEDLASTVKSMLDDGYVAEKGARDFEYLQNYLPRVTEVNKHAVSSMDSLINYYGSKARKNIAKLGIQYLPEFERMVRKFTSTNMTVGNVAQLARSEEAPKLARDLFGKLVEFESIAIRAGKINLARDIAEDRKFFQRMMDVYELRHAPDEREQRILRKALQTGNIEPEEYQKALKQGLPTFHKYLGPMEFNERVRKYLGEPIDGYLKSKNAVRWGYEKGSGVADFKVWSEDLETILQSRTAKTHGTVVTKEYADRFLKEFEIPRTGSAKNKEIYAAAQQLAKKENSEIVNVHDFIKKGTVDAEGKPVEFVNADWLLGKVGKTVHMDKRMAEGFLQIAKAQRKLEDMSVFSRSHSKFMQWWARATLFGGRTTYLYNNAAGDTWKQFMAGVDSYHMSGIPSWQILLPEGKTFAGIPAMEMKHAPVGLADNAAVKYDVLRGRWVTKKEIRDELIEMNVLGGQYASTTFEEVGRHLSDEITPFGEAVAKYSKDKSVEGIGKILKSIPETGVYAIRRGEVPAFRRAAKHIEDVKRSGTYMYFRFERGYSKIDAQSMVYRLHYDYEKQNRIIKQWLPFYYWNSKNIPQEFANAFIKPGKYAALGKAVKAPYHEMFGMDSYPQDAQPDWSTVTVQVGETKTGMPIIANFSQLPPFAAQELLGILNSDNRMEGFEQALKALGSMSEPFIQVTAEQIANEDFFTNKAIRGGGKGPITESGIKEFAGINIQDKPWAQTLVHIATGFVTPLGLINTWINTIDKMPAPAYTVKLIMGVPLSVDNPAVHEYLNLNDEIGKIRNRIKNRESKLDPFDTSAYQQSLNEEIKILRTYNSYLTKQSADINKILENLAVYNNYSKRAAENQEYDHQKKMEDAMRQIMEAYKEGSWMRSEYRKQIKDQINSQYSEYNM